MRNRDFGGQAKWHEAFREWAAVELGDARQVYAREADAPEDAPLVFMPDGEAEDFREDAKSGALICPVPECPSNRLTTCAYPEKRDHFRHVEKPDPAKYPWHDPRYEGLMVRDLLKNWMADQDKVVEVRRDILRYEERELISSLLVATLSDGVEVALCYVDKRIGVETWEAHDDYFRRQGLTATWIFALRKSYFERPDQADAAVQQDLVLDRPIYRSMRKRGTWPLLLNPELEEWANLILPGGSRAKNLGLPRPNLDRVLHLERSRMDEGRLCRYGIKTPPVPERVLEVSSHN